MLTRNDATKRLKINYMPYGLYKKEVEEIIAILIENNYLNEERFAVQFVGGKFRMKHWGRKKIQYELQQKGVGSYFIKLCIKRNRRHDYLETLQKLALAKWKSLAGQQTISRQAKTYAYLLQKGFEPAIISKVLNDIKSV